MQIKGVTKTERIEIDNILKPYKNKYKFYCYGSRAKGNFRPLSDLDIMIKGAGKANINDIENLKTLFDNSNLSYVVNLADFYNLSDTFYNLIEKDLIEL